MSQSDNLPQAISHKKLSYLFLKAQKDLFSDNHESNVDNLEKKELLEFIEQWESTSKELIHRISSKNDSIFSDDSSNSLMALGAMEAHLNMALQAFKAYKKNNDS